MLNKPENVLSAIKVKRHLDNPIITPQLSVTLGDNINGPSVIKVPSD